eukprot:364198-Chlamydomonas_euryale.AAC.8
MCRNRSRGNTLPDFCLIVFAPLNSTAGHKEVVTHRPRSIARAGPYPRHVQRQPGSNLLQNPAGLPPTPLLLPPCPPLPAHAPWQPYTTHQPACIQDARPFNLLPLERQGSGSTRSNPRLISRELQRHGKFQTHLTQLSRQVSNPPHPAVTANVKPTSPSCHGTLQTHITQLSRHASNPHHPAVTPSFKPTSPSCSHVRVQQNVDGLDTAGRTGDVQRRRPRGNVLSLRAQACVAAGRSDKLVGAKLEQVSHHAHVLLCDRARHACVNVRACVDMCALLQPCKHTCVCNCAHACVRPRAALFMLLMRRGCNMHQFGF